MPQVLVRGRLRCSHLSLTKDVERRRGQSNGSEEPRGDDWETKERDFFDRGSIAIGKIPSMEDRGTDGTQGSLSRWWPFLALAWAALILATGNVIFRYFSGNGTATPFENPHAYTINSPTRVKVSDGDSITVSVRLVGFATAESRRKTAHRLRGGV
jgi:hypothetical protein